MDREMSSMKKQLLKKIAKGASIALLAGAMVCGASLTNVNASSNKSAASEENGIHSGEYNSHNLGATAPKVKNSKVNKNSKRSKNAKRNKGYKKSTKKSKKSAKHGKKLAKRAKKGSKKNTKKFNKRARKAAAKKAALKRAKRLARRNRAEEPMNRRGYRHANKRNAKRVQAFRKSAYYRNTWTNALKINKKGIRKDKKAMKFDQKRGYKGAVKYLQGKINYLNGYVRNDARMLSLK